MVGGCLIPLNYIGTIWGARYFAYGGQRYFGAAALSVLVLVAAATLLAALRDLLAG